jgi:hypothetical protein
MVSAHWHKSRMKTVNWANAEELLDELRPPREALELPLAADAFIIERGSLSSNSLHIYKNRQSVSFRQE